MAKRRRHVKKVSCPTAKRSLSREYSAFKSAVSKSVTARNKAVRKCVIQRRKRGSKFSYYKWRKSFSTKQVSTSSEQPLAIPPQPMLKN